MRNQKALFLALLSLAGGQIDRAAAGGHAVAPVETSIASVVWHGEEYGSGLFVGLFGATYQAEGKRQFPSLDRRRRGDALWRDLRTENGQTLPWGVQRMRAPEAWAETRGEGVRVAVVDTGIATHHPDLKLAGGFNAVRANPFRGFPPDPKLGPIFSDDSYFDFYGHGTAVAGAVAALDNGIGTVGVAPGISLYAVKVAHDLEKNIEIPELAAGIRWCAQMRMDVVVISLGLWGDFPELHAAIREAAASGVTIVAAAGNNGTIRYPAAYPETIAVAASGPDDFPGRYAVQDPRMEFIAPGREILTTAHLGGYKLDNGTSLAAPYVAGAAALAIAAQGLRGVDAVRAALKRAATPLAQVGKEEQGAGMIDARKLVSPLFSAGR